jgi:hypothetical protein
VEAPLLTRCALSRRAQSVDVIIIVVVFFFGRRYLGIVAVVIVVVASINAMMLVSDSLTPVIKPTVCIRVIFSLSGVYRSPSAAEPLHVRCWWP